MSGLYLQALTAKPGKPDVETANRLLGRGCETYINVNMLHVAVRCDMYHVTVREMLYATVCAE